MLGGQKHLSERRESHTLRLKIKLLAFDAVFFVQNLQGCTNEVFPTDPRRGQPSEPSVASRNNSPVVFGLTCCMGS